MPSCQVDMGFYRPDREYRSGETVQGWVRVTVSQSVVCHGLKIKAFWETDGKGNRTRKNYFQSVLFHGRWTEGETYEYQFEFQLPDYPLTYHGENLSIDHHVSARAEIPWPVDAFRFEEINVRPGVEVTSIPTDKLPPIVPSRWLMMVPSTIGGLLILAGLLMVWNTAGASLLLSLFGAWLIYAGAGPRVTGSMLGHPQIDFQPAYITPERETTVRAQLTPRRSVRLRDASVEIRATERVITKRRKEQYRLEHALFVTHLALSDGRDLAANEPVTLSSQFRIPATDAYTIDLPENQVEWRAIVTFRVAFLPVWRVTQPFRLMPPKTEVSVHSAVAHSTGR